MSERDMLLYLLLEENEDEEILFHNIHGVNADPHPMFQSRRDEGCFTTLINRHLLEDERKFREFFRLNIAQFNYILDLIKEDIRKDSSNRFPYPITPDEKLAVTLR